MFVSFIFILSCLFSYSTSKGISKKESTELGQRCGKRPAYGQSEFKVWRGELANVGQFPWAVNFDGAKFCGGTLITRRHVLTSAHCAFYEGCFGHQAPPSTYQVYLGHLEMNKGYEFGVSSVKFPSRYGKGASKVDQCLETGGDIAVLELNRDVPQQLLDTGFVGFGCLPSSNDKYDNSDLIVHGWGYTVNTHPLGKLVWTTLKKLSYQACNRNWKKSTGIAIADDYSCAKEINTNVCLGDSGGPLLQKHGSKLKVMGIVSAGKHCGDMIIGKEYNGGVYTDVRKYLSWICEQTGACYNL